MAIWGQEWIAVEPSVHQVDVRFLMWDVRRNVKPLPDLPSRFTVRFYLPDADEALRVHWLVFENNEVDLCYFDPGHQVDVDCLKIEPVPGLRKQFQATAVAPSSRAARAPCG